jgi:peroxiredoxin Q/BCP
VEATEFSGLIAEFKKKDTIIIGVSRDSIASHQKFMEKYKIKFPLLTDPDHKIHESYGAWGEKMMYGKTAQGVIRSTFIISPEGKIVKLWTKVKSKGHAEIVLSEL